MNGKASTSFSLRSGCRQGDPISPYLFILCTEVCKVREDTGEKGTKISDTEFKISHFADDTSLLLEGGKNSHENLFRTLYHIAKMFGLKLNYDKTCIG